MANQYQGRQKYEQAIEIYQYVIDHWPDDEYAMRSEMEVAEINVLSLIKSGDDPNAQAALDRLIADFNDHPTLPLAVFLIAEQYFYGNNYHRAIELWELLLYEYPGSHLKSEIPYLLATCYEVTDNRQMAIQYYQQVLEKYPNSRYAHRVPLQIGVLCRSMGEYGEALYWLKQQRELYSEKQLAQWALFEQGAVYRLDLKDYEKAAEVFQQYISEYPDDEHTWPSYYGLAKCYENTGNKAQAITVLQEANERLSTATYADQIRYEYLREELRQLQEGGGQ